MTTPDTYEGLVAELGPWLNADAAQAFANDLANRLGDVEWTLEFLQLPLADMVDQILQSDEDAALAAEQLVASGELIETLEGILSCIRAAEARIGIALAARQDKDALLTAARATFGLTAAQ